MRFIVAASRYILAVAVGVAGWVAACYVGLAIFVVDGIEKIVHGANSSPMSGSKIGWGVVQIFCASTAAAVIAIAALALAFVIALGPVRVIRWFQGFDDTIYRRRRRTKRQRSRF